jgi:hypothetical protein
MFDDNSGNRQSSISDGFEIELLFGCKSESSFKNLAELSKSRIEESKRWTTLESIPMSFEKGCCIFWSYLQLKDNYY